MYIQHMCVYNYIYIYIYIYLFIGDRQPDGSRGNAAGAADGAVRGGRGGAAEHRGQGLGLQLRQLRRPERGLEGVREPGGGQGGGRPEARGRLYYTTLHYTVLYYTIL